MNKATFALLTLGLLLALTFNVLTSPIIASAPPEGGNCVWTILEDCANPPNKFFLSGEEEAVYSAWVHSCNDGEPPTLDCEGEDYYWNVSISCNGSPSVRKRVRIAGSVLGPCDFIPTCKVWVDGPTSSAAACAEMAPVCGCP